MVLDYSKWDALELSDDSDFEPHPNVDKRSFIRAKQHQIHEQRYERRHRIETLKYERIINDGLLRRIDSLLAALRSHEATARDPNEFLMQALIESAGDPDEDQAPPAPEGVHTRDSERPRYSQMMASLVDQVKKEVDDSKTENWHKAYVKGIEGHKKKVSELQKELHQKLAELEREESRKITSDSIHTGFNVSSVSKDKDKSSAKENPKPKAVELLNPGAAGKGQLQRHDSAQSSGAEADIEDEEGDENNDDEHIEPTKLGREFAKIKIGDYKACLHYISTHHAVVSERETDGLLVEGFNAQMDGNAAYAKQCVHQALLLQYCRSLGKDGVGLFFKRYAPTLPPSPPPPTIPHRPIANPPLRAVESRPPPTKPANSSWTTSTKPTPASPPASQSSNRARPAPPPPLSSKSSSTPSTPPPKSASRSPPGTAPTRTSRPPAPSSTRSRRGCSARWRAGVWRGSMRCWGR